MYYSYRYFTTTCRHNILEIVLSLRTNVTCPTDGWVQLQAPETLPKRCIPKKAQIRGRSDVVKHRSFYHSESDGPGGYYFPSYSHTTISTVYIQYLSSQSFGDETPLDSHCQPAMTHTPFGIDPQSGSEGICTNLSSLVYQALRSARKIVHWSQFCEN